MSHVDARLLWYPGFRRAAAEGDEEPTQGKESPEAPVDQRNSSRLR